MAEPAALSFMMKASLPPPANVAWMGLTVAKFVRGGAPRDVGVAGGIHRDAAGRVEGVAADEGRVDERVARRVELRQEAFKKAAAECGLQGVGCGEVGRTSLAGDVGVAGGVHCDPDAHVVTGEVHGVAAAAEVGGVDERRARRVELGDEGVAV